MLPPLNCLPPLSSTQVTTITSSRIPLILTKPGSGKTRVITGKVLHLIRASPHALWPEAGSHPAVILYNDPHTKQSKPYLYFTQNHSFTYP